MVLTEIKKELYKQKPTANIISVFKGAITYETSFWVDKDANVKQNIVCYFRVPFEDIGDAVFHPYMASQLLIRYIVNPNENS